MHVAWEAGHGNMSEDLQIPLLPVCLRNNMFGKLFVERRRWDVWRGDTDLTCVVSRVSLPRGVDGWPALLTTNITTSSPSNPQSIPARRYTTCQGINLLETP